jgi:hypothetical protein
MVVFAIGIEKALTVPVDRLQHSHWAKIIGPPRSAAV